MEEKKYTLTKKELNAEKTKVIGRFASVASHDLKNVLGSLLNMSYYFTKVLKVEGEMPNKMLGLLSSEIKRLNNMVTELLDMTRVKQLTKESCDLFDIVTKAIEHSKVDGINFEVNLVHIKIHADILRMTQVFSSIIQNGKDSMQNKGTISVNMAVNENFVDVIIADNGVGMDEETLENCFDPMFTTKITKGVGMGLTVALQIVEMHSGKIRIETEKGKGTAVYVTLPVIK